MISKSIKIHALVSSIFISEGAWRWTETRPIDYLSCKRGGQNATLFVCLLMENNRKVGSNASTMQKDNN